MMRFLKQLRRFLSELRRRNVYQVAIAYLAAGFVVVELADIAAGTFDLPGWFGPMVWVLVGLGFPIALIQAWALELTPEGIRREEPARSDPSKSKSAGASPAGIGAARSFEAPSSSSAPASPHKREGALEILSELEKRRTKEEEYVPPLFFAIVEVHVGREDEALHHVEQHWRAQHPGLGPFIPLGLLDKLRGEPTFDRLLEDLEFG